MAKGKFIRELEAADDLLGGLVENMTKLGGEAAKVGTVIVRPSSGANGRITRFEKDAGPTDLTPLPSSPVFGGPVATPASPPALITSGGSGGGGGGGGASAGSSDGGGGRSGGGVSGWAKVINIKRAAAGPGGPGGEGFSVGGGSYGGGSSIMGLLPVRLNFDPKALGTAVRVSGSYFRADGSKGQIDTTGYFVSNQFDRGGNPGSTYVPDPGDSGSGEQSATITGGTTGHQEGASNPFEDWFWQGVANQTGPRPVYWAPPGSPGGPPPMGGKASASSSGAQQIVDSVGHVVEGVKRVATEVATLRTDAAKVNRPIVDGLGAVVNAIRQLRQIASTDNGLGLRTGGVT